jgi:hypothetical protein
VPGSGPGRVGADEAWPRVDALMRAQAAPNGLDDLATLELLAAVRRALGRLEPFASTRAAERLANVVFIRFMGTRRRQAARRRTAMPVEVEIVPLHDVAESASLIADPADAPEDRAVMRAHFDAVLNSLLPPPTPVELEALRHSIRPPLPTRREQLRWGVRASRVRQRVREAVDSIDDLLAPAIIAFRLPSKPRGVLAAAAAGGAVAFLAVPALLVGGSAAAPQARVTAARAAAPGAVPTPGHRAVASGQQMHGLVVGAMPPRTPTRAPSHRPRGGPVVIAAGVERNEGAASAESRVAITVERHAANRMTVEVYCDSPVRAAACSLLPADEARVESP